MANAEKDRTRLLKKAKSQAGVEDLMKVYLRFEAAQAATAEYLRLIAPGTLQSNSNSSLVQK